MSSAKEARQRPLAGFARIKLMAFSRLWFLALRALFRQRDFERFCHTKPLKGALQPIRVIRAVPLPRSNARNCRTRPCRRPPWRTRNGGTGLPTPQTVFPRGLLMKLRKASCLRRNAAQKSSETPLFLQKKERISNFFLFPLENFSLLCYNQRIP